MKVDDVIHGCDCEPVLVNEETGEIITEGFVRQLKRLGSSVKRQYRCTSGPKKGRIVADPKQCAKRKDPKRRRIGKKSARLKKASRIMKTKLSKKKSLSRKITRINKRLAGK